MKRILTVAFSSLLILSLTNTACVKVDFNETEIVDTSTRGGTTPAITTLTGRIDQSLSLPKGKFTLRGFVYVGSGATLTFAPGSVIVAANDVKTALIIEQGGRLIADGSATEPIVFTSSRAVGTRTAGDWGGISICGFAPTNRPLNPAPITEGGTNRPYGGTNPNDNSGVLRFVRIEFAGITAENNSELNGLTLYGVGAGTLIENVMTGYCGDDGFEFFGGTVNARRLVSFASGDDDFDFDFGYSGRIQYAVSLRDKYSDDDAANGIESDNDGTGTAATPVTRPILSNFTLIGPFDTTGTSTNGSKHAEGNGNRWRRAARFVFRNSIILGFRAGGVELLSNETINDYLAGTSEFKNNLVHSYTVPYKSGNQALLTNAAFQAKAEAEGNITLANRDSAKLTAPFNLNTPNFLPMAGSPALTGAVYGGVLDNYFTSGTYRGAFGTENWLTGWTNFNPQTTVY
jgi:hypothetical protein